MLVGGIPIIFGASCAGSVASSRLQLYSASAAYLLERAASNPNLGDSGTFRRTAAPGSGARELIRREFPATAIVDDESGFRPLAELLVA